LTPLIATLPEYGTGVADQTERVKKSGINITKTEIFIIELEQV
jgi:hypothetical protein